MNDEIISKSTVTLQIGVEPQPKDDYSKVHKLKFISNGILVYELCWLDK